MVRNSVALFITLFIVLFISQSACTRKDNTEGIPFDVSDLSLPSASSASEDTREAARSPEINVSVDLDLGQEAQGYMAKQDSGVSDADRETAIRLCRDALFQYHSASYTHTPFDYDSFLGAGKLAEYT